MLPRSYLDTTVAIENAYPDGESTRFRTIGTGFFIGLDYGDRSPSGGDSYRLLMVTNRHVIAGKDDLIIRVNRHGGSAQHLRLPLTGAEGRTWAAHPDERVDIVVVLTNARVLSEEGLEFNYFRQPDIAFSSTMKELSVGPGQELFILGFPMGLTGVDRNYVIARAGMVARFDDELLASSRTFLIDATMFPGNSGGPVIIKPTSDSLEGNTPVDRAYLVGVVRSYLPYEEVAYSLQTEPPTARVVFIENSGLADVIPMDCVKEAADALAARIAKAPAATVLEQDADGHAGNGAG
jgi:hypothetical protein